MTCKDRILSNNYYDIITDFPVEELDVENYDMCYTNVDDIYNVLYINRTGTPSLEENFLNYQSIPKLYGLMQDPSLTPSPGPRSSFDPSSLIASGITQVQRPPLSLTGRGVVLCIIDTGIDYTQPVFLDSNKNSRILAIWDQTIQTGTPPEGFLYGSEYLRSDINSALQSQDPFSVVPSRDTVGHGTRLAGVAAGSAIGTPYVYTGAAPDADILIVKLKDCKQYLRDYYLIPPDVPAYQENDIMLAVKYADSFARTFTRPVVICLGLGTNMGDHAGSSALSRYLSTVAIRRARAVVICGGNEGNASHHYYGVLGPRVDARESSQNVEIRVADNSSGFFLEMWGNIPDIFRISILSPGGETIPSLNLGLQQSITYGFIYERTRITVGSNLVEPTSGEQLIRFRILQPTPGIWTFRISAVGDVYNGAFNLWLPITQFLDAPAYFLLPNPTITLTEPAMAADTISLSTYNADNNSFYTESGRGFSRTGLIRPLLSAPGVNVSTIDGPYTGSSLAAAITAGAVAQFLQWAIVENNSNVAESRETAGYLIRGATRTSELQYPNPEWGYGRLNLLGAFDALIT